MIGPKNRITLISIKNYNNLFVTPNCSNYVQIFSFAVLRYAFSQFSSVQSLSHVRPSATPWIAACQASLSITNSWSSPRLTSIESVTPSSHLILSSPSPPAPNPSQHQGRFQCFGSSHEVAKVLEFQLQHQSFQWTPRTDLPEFNSFSRFPSQASDSTLNPYNLSHFPFASSSALKGSCDYKKPT